MSDITKDLTLLGKAVTGTISADQLESFLAPSVNLVKFETHEVTSFCPVTAQPDLYTVIIEYTPNEKCVESKSLKLYLNSFRDQGIFGESLADIICGDLYKALEPRGMRVTTIQQIRGGLQMTAVSVRGVLA
jgi:7-cyano-7-deazaguanine reductase